MTDSETWVLRDVTITYSGSWFAIWKEDRLVEMTTVKELALAAFVKACKRD